MKEEQHHAGANGGKQQKDQGSGPVHMISILTAGDGLRGAPIIRLGDFSLRALFDLLGPHH
jgi:hypothetical protein